MTQAIGADNVNGRDVHASQSRPLAFCEQAEQGLIHRAA
jgi:hypothetical protein